MVIVVGRMPIGEKHKGVGRESSQREIYKRRHRQTSYVYFKQTPCTEPISYPWRMLVEAGLNIASASMQVARVEWVERILVTSWHAGIVRHAGLAWLV